MYNCCRYSCQKLGLYTVPNEWQSGEGLSLSVCTSRVMIHNKDNRRNMATRLARSVGIIRLVVATPQGNYNNYNNY